jgi:hypothetical protein
VVRGSDPSIGYIALQINVTMSAAMVPNSTFALQVISYRVKDIGINIITPKSSMLVASSAITSSKLSSATIPTGVVVGAAIGAIVLTSLLIIALLVLQRRWQRAKGQRADAVTSTKPVKQKDRLTHEADGPIPDPAHSAQSTPVGMEEPNDQLTTPWTEGIVSSTPSDSFLNNLDPATGLVGRTTSESGGSDQHLSSGSNGLPPEIPRNSGRPISIHSSSFSAIPDYPPPIYGLEESVRQDRTRPPSFATELVRFASTSRAPPPSFSPEPVQVTSTSATLPPSFSAELARYASANRDVINESLEAKLHAAGYLPSDDPNDLTPEQWRNEHGVTRLELNRLKNLYAR